MFSAMAAVKLVTRAAKLSSGLWCLGSVARSWGVMRTDSSSSSWLLMSMAANAVKTKPRNATVNIPAVTRVSFFEGVLTGVLGFSMVVPFEESLKLRVQTERVQSRFRAF